MARKEFTYYGKTLDELKRMSSNEFANITNARCRRSLKRGFTEQHKILLKKIKNKEKNIKTHCKDIVIIPEMIGSMLKVYNGKEFIIVTVQPEMIGHYLGEYIITTKKVQHSAPGIGATKSSASLSVK